MNPDWEQLWRVEALRAHDRQAQSYRRGIPFDRLPASKGRSHQRHNEIAEQRKKSAAAKKARRLNRGTR